MAASESNRPLHVAVFVDQHPHTLGGMQTSVLLQQRFLERLGHHVTVVGPALRGGAQAGHHVIGLPGLPLGPGEYSLNVPSRSLDRRLDTEMAELSPVDVVHVQGDFWGAVLGYRFARRHRVPVVHTMHNRLDVGLEATVPFPGLVQGGLGLAQKLLLRRPGRVPRGAWSYLRNFADAAAAVTAPSTHFARLLEEERVFSTVDVVPTGLDDDALLASPGRGADRERPRLLWIGRFSPEKRLLPFIEAVIESGQEVDVHLFGDGAQRGRAEALAAAATPGPSFTFRGKVPYDQMLVELAEADALVQTSIGFETQGMTVFEAAALGTPTVLSDHRIAADLPDGSYWLTPDSTVGGLAEALRSAVAQLKSGVRWEASESSQLLQSRQTEKMLGVYRRVLG